MALIISSVFYNQDPTTNSFFSRGSLLFYAVLVNAFASFLEILTLYAQRPIVEKHQRYALYRPAAEGAAASSPVEFMLMGILLAMASMLCDIPAKIITATVVNLIMYFMTNLRREPAAFFIFFLVSHQDRKEEYSD
jgi:ATP-binding cassette subfamily G (WHITE) protein 2 (PDR)